MTSNKPGAVWFFPLLLIATQCVCAKPAFCYIDRVTAMGQSVVLHFQSGSNVFVRISKMGKGVSPADKSYQEKDGQIHRWNADGTELEADVVKVVLSPGEEAFVGGGIHSSCEVRLAQQGQVRGVQMEASVGLPGIPPQVTRQFVPASTAENAQP
ncbi:MAG TPA: hypothetical protein VL997_09865 [Dyella sp.]|nr:hypothetical protein [Dyella sp.]